MCRKIIVSLIGFLIINSLVPSVSLATYPDHYSIPTDFLRCPDPGGTKVASYDEGWHWIVGEDELRWGSDYVYDIGNQKYVQCYCPIDDDPKGIQTNWMPASQVSQEKQEKLISKGWILVNGADFGLPPVPYLAKNSKFICKPNNDNSCHNWDIKDYPKPPSVNKLLKKLNVKIDKVLD